MSYDERTLARFWSCVNKTESCWLWTGLLGIGGLTSLVKGAFAKKFFKAAGLAVIAFAIFNISNGLGLTGINLAYSQEENININESVLELAKYNVNYKL